MDGFIGMLNSFNIQTQNVLIWKDPHFYGNNKKGHTRNKTPQLKTVGVMQSCTAPQLHTCAVVRIILQQSSFSQTHNIGNNASTGISGFTM